jgi:hypothetical protein
VIGSWRALLGVEDEAGRLEDSVMDFQIGRVMGHGFGFGWVEERVHRLDGMVFRVGKCHR